MARGPILLGGLAALVVLGVAGFWLTRSGGRTPEGSPLLTTVPSAGSFAPRDLPRTPVLANTAADGVAVDFGYKVAGIAYSYTLVLRFPPDADEGTASLGVRHAGKSATVKTKALRLWDAPRDAYAVAVQGRPDIDPAAPALCLKAVIGPDKARYDLSNASLCVAQLDGKGTCHPETLACGQIRPRS